jgi:hypothetical protein
MRLCWADKIPLALLALLTLVLLWLGSGPTPPAYQDVTEAQHWAAGLWIEWFLFLKYILPVWVVLRIADLLCGGPYRRRANRGLPPRFAGPGSSGPIPDPPSPSFIQEALERRVREWDAAHPVPPSKGFDLVPGEWTRSGPDWSPRKPRPE